MLRSPANWLRSVAATTPDPTGTPSAETKGDQKSLKPRAPAGQKHGKHTTGLCVFRFLLAFLFCWFQQKRGSRPRCEKKFGKCHLRRRNTFTRLRGVATHPKRPPVLRSAQNRRLRSLGQNPPDRNNKALHKRPDGIADDGPGSSTDITNRYGGPSFETALRGPPPG